MQNETTNDVTTAIQQALSQTAPLNTIDKPTQSENAVKLMRAVSIDAKHKHLIQPSAPDPRTRQAVQSHAPIVCKSKAIETQSRTQS